MPSGITFKTSSIFLLIQGVSRVDAYRFSILSISTFESPGIHKLHSEKKKKNTTYLFYFGNVIKVGSR